MIPFLLAIAVAFSLTGVFTALALEGGTNPLTVVTVRSLTMLAVMYPWLRWNRAPLALPRRDLVLAALIALPLSINNWFINAAFGEIPVPLVVLIFYLWPALITLSTWVLKGERPTGRAIAALVLAFAGVALALNVDFTAAQTLGVAYSLAAAVTWTVVFLLQGHFFHGRDTRATTFYMTLTTAAIFLLACVATATVQMPVTTGGWTGLLAVGPLYAFALLGLFAATARLGPPRVGFYMNFEPVAAVVFAALILDQTLAPVQLAGAALIICALFLFRSGRASPSRGS